MRYYDFLNVWLTSQHEPFTAETAGDALKEAGFKHTHPNSVIPVLRCLEAAGRVCGRKRWIPYKTGRGMRRKHIWYWTSQICNAQVGRSQHITPLPNRADNSHDSLISPDMLGLRDPITFKEV